MSPLRSTQPVSGQVTLVLATITLVRLTKKINQLTAELFIINLLQVTIIIFLDCY